MPIEIRPAPECLAEIQRDVERSDRSYALEEEFKVKELMPFMDDFGMPTGEHLEITPEVWGKLGDDLVLLRATRKHMASGGKEITILGNFGTNRDQQQLFKFGNSGIDNKDWNYRPIDKYRIGIARQLISFMDGYLRELYVPRTENGSKILQPRVSPQK